MVKSESKDNTVPRKVKVLFIGNSYTNGIAAVLRQAVAQSPYRGSTLTLVWGGGATLEGLIENGRALKWMAKGPWDYVVLQEQSLRPAIGGRSEQLFHDAVDRLVGEIRKVGAEPILYLTWGRRDGDGRRAELATFQSMQAKLSAAYRKAAERNGIRLAPVGEAWAMVRELDAALGRALYEPDGSHPSAKGAYLATCVFFRVLFDDALEEVHLPEGMDEAEGRLIRETVRNLPLTSGA